MKYTFFFLAAFCVACNDNSTDTNSSASTMRPDTVATANATNCYTYHTASDSVTLTLTTSGQHVSGNLMYAYAGKDKNSGTINGTIKGDTMLADYTFMSEGETSVRQVAFLRKDDGLVEGYGEAIQDGEKMVFKNTGALNFGGTMILKKTSCSNR